MKTNIIFFILFFYFININAQKAIPNFKVTDIYGVKHNLYNDYLDKGKYVFIDFFNTSCPSCNILAPVVDTVFRDFGCNYGDVIFLAIERGHNDAETFKFCDDYNMTFPSSSGNEGGGNQAHINYNISYTPYKIIISNNYEIVSDNPYGFNETAEKLKDTLLTFGLNMQACQGNDFMFYSLISEKDSIVGEIDAASKTISVNFPLGTDLTSLTANFRNAVNSTIKIDNVNQISGETVNDFTSSVVYKITSETGVMENWTVNVTTSSNINYLNSKFNIYPNPSSGVFIIENKYGKTKASISDITGKIIKNFILNEQDVIIDLTEKTKGIYLITIETKLGLVTKKMMVY